MELSRLETEDLNWCVKRLPEEVKNLMKANPGKLVLAGGYIRSRIANEQVNDIDLFSPSQMSAAQWAHELVGAKMPASTEQEVRLGMINVHTKVHKTDNAYSVRLKSGMFVQFIHRWTFDSPEKIVPSFDFTIAQAAMWFGRHHTDDSKVFVKVEPCWTSLCSTRFYPDLAAKRLVYTQPIRNEDAGGSMLRVLKFYQRGYRITLPSLSEVIARLVDDINWEDIAKSSELNNTRNEVQAAHVICGLLREVDPNTPID